MTIYLTKKVNGTVHHFRTTVEQTGVEIVHGVFYQWLHKHWHEYDDVATAMAKQQELVQDKINEGYKATEYNAIPENTLNIYDKAKWHFEGDFPEGLDAFQGYVHTGMFFGWLIDHDLVSDQFKEDFAAEISSFRQRQHTGAQLYQSCCDGVLMLDDLNELGNRFALSYFNFDAGEYLSDYEATLGMDVPTIYHVKDTWANYQKLKEVIDFRYKAWQQQQ
jgi:hypothetical protein